MTMINQIGATNERIRSTRATSVCHHRVFSTRLLSSVETNMNDSTFLQRLVEFLRNDPSDAAERTMGLIHGVLSVVAAESFKEGRDSLEIVLRIMQSEYPRHTQAAKRIAMKDAN